LEHIVMTPRIYKGRILQPSGETLVTVDGEVLDPRLDLANKSPSGFAWGYSGSGPAQLALAILADHYRHVYRHVQECNPEDADALALRYFQAFKDKAIAILPEGAEWSMGTPFVEATLRGIGGRTALEEAIRQALPEANATNPTDRPADVESSAYWRAWCDKNLPAALRPEVMALVANLEKWRDAFHAMEKAAQAEKAAQVTPPAVVVATDEEDPQLPADLDLPPGTDTAMDPWEAHLKDYP
jgi:hypothetical protein